MSVSTDLQLNKQQLEAIKHEEGPLLVIAGAGTGKTTVVTERIKHLILSEKARSQEILALTFTEKAAREMEERVDVAMPYGYTQMWILTFHAFCDRVLRDEALNIGLDTRFRLLTEAESVRFLSKNLFKLDLAYFRPLGNPTRFVSGLLQHFSRLKDEDIAPDDYVVWANNQQQTTNNPPKARFDARRARLAKDGKEQSVQGTVEKQEAEKWLELSRAYKKYEELKIQEGVMDYADLISNTLKLFREKKDVTSRYHKQFKYVLVDEFQDTNIAQNELVKLLADDKQNLTVVADDDQAVYRWRGAATSNVIQFRDNFPQAKVVALTQNYRSTQVILDTAYQLIQHNNPDRLEVKEKIDKKLKAIGKSKGEFPEFIHADRVENEAQLVAQQILQLTGEAGYAYSDFAILVRANNHAEPFSRAFARLGIPYQFLGPGKLFAQEEVKELIAYLKVLANFEDSLSFYKLLAMEYWDLPARDLAAISNQAYKYKQSLFEVAEKIEKISVSQETKENLKTIIQMIHGHLKLVPKETAGQILYKFLAESGILQTLGNASTQKEETRVLNISKFFDKLKSFESQNADASVFAVVEWIDLATDVGESPLVSDFDWGSENAVNILTIHSAKGLEFPVVFVVNLVSQRFPTLERKEQIPIPEDLIKEILPQGDYHLQEERRLFYVALTRAKERLFVTAANYYGEGKREKKLSPFVYETFGVVAKQDNKTTIKQLSILDYSTVLKEEVQSSGDTEKIVAKRRPVSFLSYTQMETFRFCPLHYKLRYILKIPTPTTAALSFGNTLHGALKSFCEQQMNGKPVGRDELLEYYHQAWVGEGYDSREHEQEMKKRGERYLESYLASKLYQPDNHPVIVEMPFVFALEGGLKVGGKMDRIDKTKNGIEIIDYKTTDYTHKELPTEKDLAGDLQLSVYAMAACKVADPVFQKQPEEVTLSLYFFDKGVKVSTKRTWEDLKKAEEEILQIKEEIETSDFACSAGIWCQRCEYQLFCGIKV